MNALLAAFDAGASWLFGAVMATLELALLAVCALWGLRLHDRRKARKDADARDLEAKVRACRSRMPRPEPLPVWIATGAEVTQGWQIIAESEAEAARLLERWTGRAA